MELAGWVLIIAGLVWIGVRTFADIRAKQATAQEVTLESGKTLVLPSPEGLAKLAAAPYGTGITLVLIGAVLLMTARGITVSFATSPGTASPTEQPS